MSILTPSSVEKLHQNTGKNTVEISDIEIQEKEKYLKDKQLELGEEKSIQNKIQEKEVERLKQELFDEKTQSTTTTKNIMDDSASSYDNDPVTQSFFLTEKSSVLDALRIQPWDKIVDLWCWTGKYLQEFAKVSDTKLYGIDVSQKMLDVTAKKLHLPQENLQVVDIWNTSLPYADNSIDKISCAHVIKFLSHDQFRHLVQEVKRVLKPWWKAVFTNNTPLDATNRINWDNVERQKTLNTNSDEDEASPTMYPYNTVDYKNIVQDVWLHASYKDIAVWDWDVTSMRNLLTEDSFAKVVWQNYLYQITISK